MDELASRTHRAEGGVFEVGMALEYVKIWTTFFDDEWVQSLSGCERGVFIQLVILCRKSGDFSKIYTRSYPVLAGNLGVDGKTARKILGKFHEAGKIIIKNTESGSIQIELPNYQFWQDLRPEKESRELVKNRGKVREKSGKSLASKPSQEKPSQTNIYIAEIISDLNSKSGKTYQPESAATVRLVTALLNRKFTVDQFKHVHTVKCAEWLKTDMEKYLRPSTLYGSHFEEYLNQGKSTVKSEAETKYEGVTING